MTGQNLAGHFSRGIVSLSYRDRGRLARCVRRKFE